MSALFSPGGRSCCRVRVLTLPEDTGFFSVDISNQPTHVIEQMEDFFHCALCPVFSSSKPFAKRQLSFSFVGFSVKWWDFITLWREKMALVLTVTEKLMALEKSSGRVGLEWCKFSLDIMELLFSKQKTEIESRRRK